MGGDWGDSRGVTLADVEARLAGRTPEVVATGERPVGVGARAAVAVVLRELAGDGDGLELLLIKRAEHERDPWSGHVALPGRSSTPRFLTSFGKNSRIAMLLP